MKFINGYSQFLFEGRVVNFDKKQGNFIVLMGGPGSGKSTVSKSLINAEDIKYFNVDTERERMAKKLGLDLSKPEDNREILKHTYSSTDPRNRTINLLKTTLESDKEYLPNIVFDTVGTHVDLMKELISLAKSNGYETTMVLVKTDIDIALDRNRKRSRRLADSVVVDYHNRVEKAFDKLIPYYDNAWIVHNNEPITIWDRGDNAEKIK